MNNPHTPVWGITDSSDRLLKAMVLTGPLASLFLLLQFGADLGEDFVVSPCSGRVGFLMVIGFQNQIARREQNLFHLGILPYLLPCRGHN